MDLIPIEHVIYLDFASPYAESIEVNQYDNGTNQLKIILTDNGQNYSLDGFDVKICGTKPDGTQILSNADSWSDNIICYTLTDWDTSEYGQIRLEVRIYNSNNFLLKSSPTFLAHCSKGALDENKVINTPPFSALTETINDVKSSINRSELLNSQLTILHNDLESLQDNLTLLKDETLIAKDETIDATNRTNATVNKINTLHDSVSLAEQPRRLAESERIENESLRLTSESNRETNEVDRQHAEINRNNNEYKRILNEQARDNAELIRIENENGRISDELERKSNENIRSSAESIRVESENKRISNEDLRQINTAIAIKNANTAADRANIAAEACEGIIEGTGLISTTEKGIANGVATLDENGKLIASQSPFSINDITNNIVNDSVISEVKTWSSEKINAELETVTTETEDALKAQRLLIDGFVASVISVDKATGTITETSDLGVKVTTCTGNVITETLTLSGTEETITLTITIDWATGTITEVIS